MTLDVFEPQSAPRSLHECCPRLPCCRRHFFVFSRSPHTCGDVKLQPNTHLCETSTKHTHRRHTTFTPPAHSGAHARTTHPPVAAAARGSSSSAGWGGRVGLRMQSPNCIAKCGGRRRRGQVALDRACVLDDGLTDRGRHGKREHPHVVRCEVSRRHARSRRTSCRRDGP